MTQVIINDILPRTQAVATGGQTVFSTNWTADSAADVVVFQTPDGDAPDDATQILASDQYNVAFIGGSQIVQVTLIVAANLGDIITITRATPVSRSNLYTNTNFTPTMLNQDFGLTTLQIQENDLSETQLTPRYPMTAELNSWDVIIPQLGPGESWVMNDAGDQIVAQVAGGGSGDVLAALSSHSPGEGASLVGLNPSGTVQDFANNNFIVKTANATIPNAQALSALANGLLKNATGTGTLSIAVAGTDYYAPGNTIPIADGGTGATTATAARANLGIAIGTNVEAWSAALDSIAALTTAADKMIYTTALNVYATTDLTSVARTLLAQTSNPNILSTIGALPLAGGTMTGAINMSAQAITNLLDAVNPQDAATLHNVTTNLGLYLPLTGGTMSGVINMGNHKITALSDPSVSTDAVTLNYLNTQLALYLALSGGTMTGQVSMGSHKIVSLTDPTNPQDAATKNYVDSIAVGFEVKAACAVATTANLNGTYVNGASGIGATLTNAGALTALVIDGYTVATNDRILVKNQSSAFQNGVYVATNVGSGAVAWILTRASDFDQPSEIQPGDLVVINNGTANAGTSWIQTATVSAVGTDAINFSQFTFSATAVLLKANNLSDVANTTTAFNNISPMTTKGDLIGFSTQNVRLAVGATDGQILQVLASAATGLAYSTATYPVSTTANRILYSSATNVVGQITSLAGGVLVTDASSVPSMLTNPTAANKMLLSANAAIPTWSTSTIPTSAGSTAGKVLLSDGTNYVLSTPTFPNSSASSGKIIISDGTNWIASTPTYPNTSGSAGKVVISDGTNNVYSTPTFPNASATSNKIIRSDGTNWIASTVTYPDASVTAGKVIISDGTNYIASTPTFPNASATTRKIIVSDGTNWIASTETYATPGSSGNVLTSDGTNWTSAAAAGITLLTTKGDLFGFSTVNARVPVATGNGKILQVDSTAGVGVSYSTPTYPSASGTVGLFLVSDGTNNVYSAKAAFTTINTQLLTSGTTYTPTTGTKFAIFEMVGGGGGVGGIASASGVSSGATGGGGGGSYLRILATIANIGATATYAIGAAGAAGTSGANAGGKGGDTTITINSSTWTAAGGNGSPGVTVSTSAVSGAGGASNANTTGSNATLMANIQGKSGSNSMAAFGTFLSSGIGGSTSLGLGGIGGVLNTTVAINSTGTSGTGYGAGAGGAGNNTHNGNIGGTAGQAGAIIVTEFIYA